MGSPCEGWFFDFKAIEHRFTLLRSYRGFLMCCSLRLSVFAKITGSGNVSWVAPFNFITNTPLENRGIINISSNDGGEIFFGPLSEKFTVALLDIVNLSLMTTVSTLVFGSFPLVESFLLNQETHLITQLNKFFGGGFVTSPYCVHPRFFQSFQTTLPNP